MTSSAFVHWQVTRFEDNFLETTAKQEFISFCEQSYEQLLTNLPFINIRIKSLSEGTQNAEPLYLLQTCNDTFDTTFNDCEKMLPWLYQEQKRLSRRNVELRSYSHTSIVVNIMEVQENESLLSILDELVNYVEAILLRKKLPAIIQSLVTAQSKVILRHECIWDYGQSFHENTNRYFHTSLLLYHRLYERLPHIWYKRLEKIKPDTELRVLKHLIYVSRTILDIIKYARSFDTLMLDDDIVTPAIKYNFYTRIKSETESILNNSSSNDIMIAYMQHLHTRVEKSLEYIRAFIWVADSKNRNL